MRARRAMIGAAALLAVAASTAAAQDGPAGSEAAARALRLAALTDQTDDYVRCETGLNEDKRKMIAAARETYDSTIRSFLAGNNPTGPAMAEQMAIVRDDVIRQILDDDCHEAFLHMTRLRELERPQGSGR